MKRLLAMGCLAGCLLTGGLVSRAETPVFRDEFENGVPANSDAVTGFWTAVSGAVGSLVESNGSLVITAGGTESANGSITSHIYTAKPTPRYNFFQRKLKFSASVGIDGSAPASQELLRFCVRGVYGSSTTSNANEDSLSFQIKGDQSYSLSVKQNRPWIAAESVKKLCGANAGAAITGFDLTLDGTSYLLTVYHSTGEEFTTLTGTHGLIESQWGADGGSAFQFEVERATGSAAGAGMAAVGVVNWLAVDDLSPLASLFLDSFENGNPSNSDVETNIWTTSYTSSASSIAETTGRLDQTATSASAGAVVATTTTPVSSRFNFFDHPLMISAGLRINGSAANAVRRGRLVLGSSGSSGKTAADSITVGFTADNNVPFYTKVNAPNVGVDDISNPGVRALVGSVGWDPLYAFNLMLDARRYRLVTYNYGEGSRILRFCNKHDLLQSDWGARGDSALMLESYRTSSAAAGSTAIASWDDLQVDAASDRMLVEPYWEFPVSFPTSATGTATYNFRLWIPSTEPTIRGIIFIGPGSGGDFRYLVHDPTVQEAARDMGFGVIGYINGGNMNLWSYNKDLIKNAVQAVLDEAATASGHPEIRNAPLCITGLSAGGFDSCFMAINLPERLIAYVPHRAAVNVTLSDESKRVPGLWVAGGNDTNSATEPYVMKKAFANWRSQGALVGFAVDWGVGHTLGGGQGWEAAFAWLTEVVKLRYPRPMVPSTTPGAGAPALVALSESSGWLGDACTFSAPQTPAVTYAFTKTAPYAEYTGIVSSACWFPNETCARICRALTSTTLEARSVPPMQGPLHLVFPRQYCDPVKAGEKVSIRLNPRDFNRSVAISTLDFYDGSTLIGSDNTGPEYGIDYIPETTGLHVLSVVAKDTAGNQRDAFRVISVQPAQYLPLPKSASFATVNGTILSGTLAAQDPEGRDVAYSVDRQPTHGTVELDAATGGFVYRAAHGFTGSDAFDYTAQAESASSLPGAVTVTVDAATDTDRDGMPDWFETQYQVSAANGDNDGDGFTNLQEYLAYTDPRDPDNHVKISSVESGSNGVKLRWSARGGVRYRIQYSDDLKSYTDVVRPVAEEIAPGDYGVSSVAEFIDDKSLTPPCTNGRRFYRIAVIQ